MTYKSLESVIRSKVRVESAYKNLTSTIRSLSEKQIETHFKDQIVIGSYRTSHFEMCPSAQLLYSDLPENVDRNAAEKAAIFLDQLFALEKSVIASQKATGEDVRQSQEYANKAMLMAKQAGLEKEHNFVSKHVDAIRKFHKPIDGNPKTDITPEDLKRLFSRPSLAQTPEPRDMDIDNQKFRISRSLKMQRKLKIIDDD